MNIISVPFLALVTILIIVYYIIPKKCQWGVLLVASGIFYLCSGIRNIFFLLATSLSIYAATCGIRFSLEKQDAYLKAHKEALTKEEKKAYRAKRQAGRKCMLIAALLFNFGILCSLKYFHFAWEQLNSLLAVFGRTPVPDTFRIIAPLGISFYTFQATGYLLDVYWENCKAEINYAKLLLFISFFPQITQGPISNFEQLSGQLFAPHSFRYDNYARGIQRLLWGFAKKMLLADLLASYVQDVFAHYTQYSGLTVFIGILMYSIQIYADFSGYMDIMCGLCEILDIRLTENFMRPYFSKSIAEYWRRWHISLGTWFKNYLYYPIGISRWNRKLAKRSKEKLGKRFGDMLPASIALIVVWSATGLWHGASWGYIVWGLLNGLFIIFSMWMEPIYTKAKCGLHINESNRFWITFQTARTFLLVSFIKVLPEVGTLQQGLGLIGRVFSGLQLPHNLSQLLPFLGSDLKTAFIKFGMVIIMTVLLFSVSLMQRKRPVRDWFAKVPIPFRILTYTFTVMLLVFFEASTAGGFMYAEY